MSLRRERSSRCRKSRLFPIQWILFANDAGNRLEQDLLMMTHGLRSRPLLRRMQCYKRCVNEFF